MQVLSRFTNFTAGKMEEKQQGEWKRQLEVEEEKRLTFKANGMWRREFVETDFKKTFWVMTSGLFVRACGQMEEITVKYNMHNYINNTLPCPQFLPLVSTGSLHSSRVNVLCRSPALTWSHVSCALKCSCSSALAAVDRHGNLELMPHQPYHRVTLVSLTSEPLCSALLQIYY